MKKLYLLGLLLFVSTISKAQDLESILLASKDDANKLAKAYLDPAMKGLMTGMNSGWYHTAKVHKKFGFDFSFRLNASMVPSEDELMDLASLGLSSNVTYTSPNSPTVLGTGDGADIIVTQTFGGQTDTATFELPSGVSEDFPMKAVPTPVLQASLGLPKNFDVMLRFVPSVGSDDVKGSLFGIGVKKEITSIFGPLDKLPLHVSVLAAYSSMNVDYTIDGTSVSGQNQSAQFKLKTFNVEAIGSLNFPVINIYGGIGYGIGTSSLKFLGDYNLQYTTSNETVTDPLDIDFKSGSAKATIGARLSLGFFKLYGDYTIQEYNTVSAGIAFSFR